MNVSRRNFLRSSGAAVAALGVMSSTRSWADEEPADSEATHIRVAVIGTRGQGKSHIAALGQHVVALCDVDARILEQRRQETEERLGRKIDTFSDYRKLLESNDIDAVSIATPNHTHALITIAACQAGKDVYVEKPVSHNVWEGRQMVAAAREYGRIVQCGTQSRSSQSLRDAVQFVREGKLGNTQYAVGTCYKPRPSIGKLAEPLQIPAHIDYDLWCGPADKRPIYRPRLHYDWHWDFNTGSGDMGNQGIHQMDIARWFLGADALAPRVISVGGRVGNDDAGNTPNTQVVMHAYPSAPLIFETRGLPRSKEAQHAWGSSMDSYRGSTIGVIIQCQEGHVLVPSYTEAIAFDADGVEIQRWTVDGNVHHQNWLEAVAHRDASRLNADIREGHLSSAICHTGNISHRVGTPLPAGEISRALADDELLSESCARMFEHLRQNEVNIDEPVLVLGQWLDVEPQSEQILGNEKAADLLTRKYRQPYVIPNLDTVAIR